jgi:hypothetical protein
MKLSDSFDQLDSLRARIGANLVQLEFGATLSAFERVVVQLETNEGLIVEREDIKTVGSFLTYKGDALAILYIFNSSNSKLDLEADFPQQSAPRFHFTWCDVLVRMEKRGRFARYVLSRSKSGLFQVEASERDPDQISLHGEHHVLDNIRLAPCQNCLDQLIYHDFNLRQPKIDRVEAVKNFSLQTYLDENDGTFNVMRFTPKHTAASQPRGGYTHDFPKISTELRQRCGWECSSCGVNMSQMKKGLHVHHINGVKGDNSESNLSVLCALCHKAQPHHETMHVASDIERFIVSNRT